MKLYIVNFLLTVCLSASAQQTSMQVEDHLTCPQLLRCGTTFAGQKPGRLLLCAYKSSAATEPPPLPSWESMKNEE